MHSKWTKEEYKLIHIRLPALLHAKVRVHCALDDISIQDWIFQLVQKEIQIIEDKHGEIPTRGGKS